MSKAKKTLNNAAGKILSFPEVFLQALYIHNFNCFSIDEVNRIISAIEKHDLFHKIKTLSQKELTALISDIHKNLIFKIHSHIEESQVEKIIISFLTLNHTWDREVARQEIIFEQAKTILGKERAESLSDFLCEEQLAIEEYYSAISSGQNIYVCFSKLFGGYIQAYSNRAFGFLAPYGPAEDVDVILHHLIAEFNKYFIPMDSEEDYYYFHKSFRQVDITNSGHIDACIYQCLSSSDLFWEMFSKALSVIKQFDLED